MPNLRGDAGPVSHARGPLEISEAVTFEHDDERNLVPVSNTVVRNREPQVIKLLKPLGKLALRRYAESFDRVSALKAQDYQERVETYSSSDGGVVGRIAIPAELKLVNSYIDGVFIKHPSGRPSSIRQPIPVLTVLEGVGVRWEKPSQVLKRHRWGLNSDALFCVNQAFGWSVLRLKIAYGLEENKRRFDPLPDYLYRIGPAKALKPIE